MKRSTVFQVSFTLVLLLALTASVSLAQEAEPVVQPDASAMVPQTINVVSSNAFTYQGQLIFNDEPVNGLCDFRFSLWDAANLGNQIDGGNTLYERPVTNGLFTVQLNFGADAFNGDSRWLETKVDCGQGIQALSPRQLLTAAPYALHANKVTDGPGSGLNADLLDGEHATAFADADHNHDSVYWSLKGNAGTTPGTQFLGTTDQQALELHVANKRALRIEPMNPSPNLIAGADNNSVSANVYGVTIAGGGMNGQPNVVTDHYGTIGGGLYNRAGNALNGLDDASAATVGGGSGNKAEGQYSTIAGGVENRVVGEAATITGGKWNNIAGNYATVGGGYNNNAKADYATIAGGGPVDPSNSLTNNKVSDDYGTVGGGAGNRAGNDDGDTENNQFATVAGGRGNKAEG